MPVGTDPKMNPREETWGILFHEDVGLCKYDKGNVNSELRFCCQGSSFHVDSVKELSDPFMWNGINIKWEAVGVHYDEEGTGPLYRELNRNVKNIFFVNGDVNNPNKLAGVRTALQNTGNSQGFSSVYPI